MELAKYGKKNKVSTELNSYSICVLGESGIGKTTLMKETCETLFGEDGYMIFNCGKEDGVDCLADASYEDIDSYKKFDEVTKDIIKNKDTDYPDLKVVVIDTLDQLFELVEPAVVNMWNRENIGKKDFVAAKTLNQSWGGFGRGEEKVLEVILDRMWELKRVGVAFWSCGHVKTREILDPLTGQTYTSLSTNMMQKYFNGIKTKMHVVGVACIDREIVKESTGRQNIVTKKDITKNQVVSESRKIIFRDDNYGVDSKSRFRNIVNEIPLNKDAFIKALKDAIVNAVGNTNSTEIATVKQKPAKSEPVPEAPVATDEPEVEDEPPFDTDTDDIDVDDMFEEEDTDVDSKYPDNLADIIRKEFKELTDKQMKADVRAIISEYGKLNDVPEEGLHRIYDVIHA